jgi:hypothetical protein
MAVQPGPGWIVRVPHDGRVKTAWGAHHDHDAAHSRRGAAGG